MIETLKIEIKELLTEPLRKNGTEIVDLVLSRYKNNVTMKLFIYTDKKSNIDECAKVSRLVGEILEGTDYFNSGYILEVSSPGLDRPLTTMLDFKYRAGEKVKIIFRDSNKKKITAEILGIENETILFKNDEGEFKIELPDIEQATIMF